ncbi:hypothetical protein [Nocardioides sp. Kera G14]|uniref:hypothetical protein n=1 Tax=Nocardioides sp. Kera G14 TaxID=2884264 RepID=UPI001D1266E7|nr:hypothetical protein [Nocardioides sp. Kera G14]UDY23084.1 hypothetical protein LH076_13585 [Nocardioides sp. Kera G14]
MADLRAAVVAALAWVGSGARVVGDSHGVVAGLLEAQETPDSVAGDPELGGVVVVANGSATRSEKAPGHLDERSHGFDDWLREALTVAPSELRRIDVALAEELWADVSALPELADLLCGPRPADFAPVETDPGPVAKGARLVSVDYDDDPYGVKYWVMRWEIDDE